MKINGKTTATVFNNAKIAWQNCRQGTKITHTVQKNCAKRNSKSSGKVEQTNSDAVNEKDIVLQPVPQKPAQRQNCFAVCKRHRRNIV